MTTRDETAAHRVPRVQPPPPLTLPTAGGAGEPGSHGWMWLTVALFAVLGVAALAVFFVLPDWVQARQELAPAAAPGPAAEPTPPAGAGDGDRQAPLEEEQSAAQGADRAPRASAPSSPAAPSRTAAPPRTPAPSPTTGPPPPAPRVDAFARAMSEGLAALDREDYAAARDAFARAGQERPGSPQSADGLLRAETALRLAEINRLRAEAVTLEAAEDWKAATARYEAVLALDPTIGFAQEGQARSRARADLADRLDFHVANPQRLSAEAVLREASAVLAQAQEIDPAGPRHARQAAALAAHVAAYSTPVRAVLESDGLTDVTIYKVGRLGAFRRHALELRPGTYTVVGSRRGYRDVRRQLVIAPGAAPAPLAVRCEEKI